MDLALISIACVALFALGTPVMVVLAGWVIATSYFVIDFPLANIGIASNESIKSFVFLAVPLFVATGDFLTEGGISRRLVNFARSVISWMPGATASTTMLSCGLFAAVSGSNAATAATMGRLLGPEMMDRGIKPGLAGAIVAAGGTVGVIIPPSVMFLVYGVTMEVPSVDLFIGGVIPGILMVVVLLGTAMFLTGRTEPSVGFRDFSFRTITCSAAKAWSGFLAIGIIFFGIYWGYFSPTEAAGVATIYCFLAATLITRQLRLRAIPDILMRSAALSGLIVPMVVFSIQFQQVASVMGLPAEIQQFLADVGTAHGMEISILIMMLLILAVGALTESVAVILILGPILAPVALFFGIDPVHWGVAFVIGTTIGFITPPYGLNLFVVSAVLNVDYGSIMRAILKLLLPLFAVWLVVTFMPWTTQYLLGR